MYYFETECLSLKATLGAYGVMTHKLDTAHDVIDVTNILFNLSFDFGFDDEEDYTILLGQQEALHKLSKRERKRRVMLNITKLPSDLLSRKPPNKGRLTRARNAQRNVKPQW